MCVLGLNSSSHTIGKYSNIALLSVLSFFFFFFERVYEVYGDLKFMVLTTLSTGMPSCAVGVALSFMTLGFCNYYVVTKCVLNCRLFLGRGKNLRVVSRWRWLEITASRPRAGPGLTPGWRTRSSHLGVSAGAGAGPPTPESSEVTPRPDPRGAEPSGT